MAPLSTGTNRQLETLSSAAMFANFCPVGMLVHAFHLFLAASREFRYAPGK